MKRIKAKKILKFIERLTITVLTLGVVIAFSLLSFTGLLFVTPSIYLAFAAFFLNGIIEGEVYRQNLVEGLNEIFRFNAIQKKLILEALRLELKKKIPKKKHKHSHANESEANASTELLVAAERDELTKFMNKYVALKQYLQKLKEKKDLRREDRAAHKAKLKMCRYQLKQMEEEFVNDVLTTSKNKVAEAKEKYGQDIYNNVRNEVPSITQRIWIVRLLVPIYVLSGITFGLVMASTLHTALIAATAAFGITMPAVVFPILASILATVAAISYAILIYRTISEIVHSAAWRKWKNTLIKLYTQGEKDSTLWYVTRCVGVTALALTVFLIGVAATLATAGTWWGAVNASIKFIPYLAQAVQLLTTILIAITIGTNLSFTLSSTIQTLEIIFKITAFIAKQIAKKGWNYLFNSIQKAWDKENVFQFFNPFRLLIKVVEIPYNILIFVGHIISVGLTGDRVVIRKVNLSLWAAGAGALEEMCTDPGYLIDLDKHTEQDEYPHQHAHDHVHGKIPNYVLALLLLPIKLASAFWDWATSQFNTGDKPILSIGKVSKRAFGFDIVKASASVWDNITTKFGIRPDVKIADASEASNDLPSALDAKARRAYVIHAKLEKHIRRQKAAWTDRALAKEKAAILTGMKTRVENDKKIKLTDEDMKTLGEDRQIVYKLYDMSSRFFQRSEDDAAEATNTLFAAETVNVIQRHMNSPAA